MAGQGQGARREDTHRRSLLLDLFEDEVHIAVDVRDRQRARRLGRDVREHAVVLRTAADDAVPGRLGRHADVVLGQERADRAPPERPLLCGRL